MKTFVKNTLIFGTIAIVLGSLWVKKKIETAVEVFEKITIKPHSLPKNIKLSNPNALKIPQDLSFNIDVVVNNPDVREFYATGLGIAKLKTISVYFKNVLIGVANLDLEEITVPPQSNFIIPNILVQGKTLGILSHITEFQNIKFSDLKFLAVVDVLGYEYEVGS